LPNMHESGKILKVKQISISFEKSPITIRRIFDKLISLIKK